MTKTRESVEYIVNRLRKIYEERKINNEDWFILPNQVAIHIDIIEKNSKKSFWETSEFDYTIKIDKIYHPIEEDIVFKELKDIVIGKPETFKNQLKPILSNERLFFIDLYKAGVGEKIENMFREMIAGPGAVKATIHKYVK